MECQQELIFLCIQVYLYLERKNAPLGKLRYPKILLISDGKRCIPVNCRCFKVFKTVTLCFFGYMLTLPSTHDRLTGHFQYLKEYSLSLRAQYCSVCETVAAPYCTVSSGNCI
jgi:hypothetical protein